MPNRNEFVRITVREWDALTEGFEHLGKAVERLEREQIVFKAKAALVMWAIGIASGGVASVVAMLAHHYLPKLLP